MIKTQPKTQQQHRNVIKPAFTLLEILTVIAIIAVLASLTLGGMSYYDQKMKYSRTEILIASIEQALEEYKADNGFYPQNVTATSPWTEQVYVALSGDGSLTRNATTGVVTIATAPNGTPNAGNTVYLSTLNPSFKGKQLNVESTSPYCILDAWGERLRYRHNKPAADMANPRNDYDLISLGPNGNGDFLSVSEAAKADDIKNW